MKFPKTHEPRGMSGEGRGDLPFRFGVLLGMLIGWLMEYFKKGGEKDGKH